VSRFSDLLPPLTPGEYEALKADIAERGVLVPIEVDEVGEILDGAHRARAAAELGLAPPARIVRRDLTEEQKRAHALALNVHRRQLGPAERRILVEQLREEGLSTRRIAQTVGVAQTTVVRDLSGEPPGSPGRITGADGKTYPASRPAPPDTVFDDTVEPLRPELFDPSAPVEAGDLFTPREVRAIFAKGPSDHARRDLSALIHAAMALRQNEAGLVEHLAEHGREDREEVLYDLSEYVERVVAFCREHLQPGLKAVK
jgi:hypothetical protein